MPERSRPAEQQPVRGPLSRIIVHNDNVTPMDFVVHVLVGIFGLPPLNAVYIMYAAHLTGKAHVQTLPRPDARLRVNKAHLAARLKTYPLQFSLEPE